MARRPRIRIGRGVVTRVARPFVFLVLLLGLIGGAELSAAIATEFLSTQEAELGRLLNEERTARGLPELGRSDGLRTVARRHAQRMMQEGTIFHNERLREDVEAIFPDWARIGENVGVGPSIPSVHQAFMDSPGHRANVLDPDWGWMGIGVVTGDRRLFMTENFLKLQAGAARPTPTRLRLAGSTRIGTAQEVADFAFRPGGAGGAVVADASDFHGALAAAALAGAVNGPIVLTERDALAEEAEAALRRALGSSSGKTVYLVGGPFSGGVQDDLEALGVSVVALGGADHVETAAAVARALPSRPSAAFVATVENYPDALAASAVSAITGSPVLYTDPNSLSDATGDLLRELRVGTTHVVGGTAAVSNRVSNQIDAISGVSRIAGPDRYATATAVADFGLGRGLSAGHVLVATGTNFPDALAGGAISRVLRSPVVLSPPSDLHGTTASWLRAHRGDIDAVYLLGGEAALSSRVDDAIGAALG